MSAPAPAPSPWKQTLAAARANLVPGLALQAFALAVVVAYYHDPFFHGALDRLADFKNRLGFTYSVIATAIFGGAIPSLYLLSTARGRKGTPPSHVLFYLLFWAWKGFEVDLFYRAQGWAFGNGVSPGIIACKVVVDQFVYSPLWSAPLTLLSFHWKESGFQASSLLDLHWMEFLRGNLPKAILATWVIWIPAVAIIYSLPPALQIPLFNIVLCFFSLLYITLTRRQNQGTASS